MVNQSSSHSVRSLAKTAIVAAVYVALTLLVSPVAFGPIQFRISEALNFIGLYNRRYVWAICIGVFIVNSLNGPIDMVIGTGHTLISLVLARWLGEKLAEYITQQTKKKIDPMIIQYLVLIIIFTLTMVIIAWMLWQFFDAPFWASYASLALSELIVLSISAFIMYPLCQRIDFNS